MKIWPDEKLEHAMLSDAEHLERSSTSGSVDRNAACHIKALLCRVRDLEKDCAGYEAMKTGVLVRIANLEYDNAHFRSLIAELTDSDECSYDHHGLCQAHSLQEKPCPHERAKKEIDDGK